MPIKKQIFASSSLKVAHYSTTIEVKKIAEQFLTSEERGYIAISILNKNNQPIPPSEARKLLQDNPRLESDSSGCYIGLNFKFDISLAVYIDSPDKYETWSYTLTVMPYVHPMDVIKSAYSYFGTQWGAYNCTGAVYSITNKIGVPLRGVFNQNLPVDQYKDNLKKELYLDSATSKGGYSVPLVRTNENQKASLSAIDYSDAWDSVDIKVNGHYDFSKVQAGDLIRFNLVTSRAGTGTLHSAIIAGFDESTDTLYLIDNLSQINGASHTGVGYSSYSIKDNVDQSEIVSIERLHSSTRIGNEKLQGADLNETIGGGDGNDTIYGFSGSDLLLGNHGNDILYGGAGEDTLVGGNGADSLYGGMGKDLLKGGGGSDVFYFSSALDSSGKNPDIIFDFSILSDRLDLSEIDANTKQSGNQAFSSIQTAFRKGQPGILAVSYKANQVNEKEFGSKKITAISGDVDGDAIADFSIWLVGSFEISALIHATSL